MANDKGANCVRQYVNQTEVVTKAKVLPANCNSICFINKGTSTALVNGFDLANLQGICFDGDAGECDMTNYNISFTGGGTNKLFVFRKYNSPDSNGKGGCR